MSSIDRAATYNGIASVGREHAQPPAEQFPEHGVPIEVVMAELAFGAVAAAAVLAAAALLVRKVVRSI